MNASSTSPSPPVLNGDNMESDSDTNPEQEPDYYQPISATDVGDSDGCNSDNDHHGSSNYHTLENGHCSNDLSINDGESDEKSSDEEEEEEERIREEIVRAFTQDERRRHAPLSEENARRVMEAMRGISFGGLPPPRINEDQWLARLRSLRQSPNTSGTSALNHHV